MANSIHLDKLSQGVNSWNKWRVENSGVKVDLSDTNISEEVSYRRYKHVLRAVFPMISLLLALALNQYFLQPIGKTLNQDNNQQILLTVFSSIVVLGVYIVVRLTLFKLIAVYIFDLLATLNLNPGKVDLNGFDLSYADLSDSRLRFADLTAASLRSANLSRSNLSHSRNVGADFEQATLTGACIDNWSVDSSTNLKNIICDYVYLEEGNNPECFEQRRPIDKRSCFANNDFSTLVETVSASYDLIFTDGIDWKTFLNTFQEFKGGYDDKNISIQAIESKSENAFVIRIMAVPEIDESEIEKIKSSYEKKLYSAEKSLEFSNEKLEFYKGELKEKRERNTDLYRVIETLAGKNQSFEIVSEDIASTSQNIQTLLELFKNRGANHSEATQEVARELAEQVKSDPSAIRKLLAWTADTVGKATVAETTRTIIRFAIKMATGISVP